MAKKKKIDKPFDGKVDLKGLLKALSEIEDFHNITPQETLSILETTFAKAYKTTVNENAKNAEDMRIETKIDIKGGSVDMYELKDVVKEEDLEDDFMQISVEDAKEIDKDAQEGSILRIPVDFLKLGEKYTRKVIQLFLQKIKEEAHAASRSHFSSLIGTNIIGTIENVESNRVTVAFDNDKVTGVMYGRDILPNEELHNGDRIKCYLKGIDEKRRDLTLLISRTDRNFLTNLFREHIHEVSEGIINIHSVSRVAGERAKISVSSNDENVDPTGSCIGPDGSRIDSIRRDCNKERIDIVRYCDDINLYIAEALRPAEVIGVNTSIDPDDPSKVLAVVKNDGKRVAIGKNGINVRLASQLVGKTIDIKELDEAMRENIKYTSIEDIKRELALDELAVRAKTIELEEYNPEVEEEIEEKFAKLSGYEEAKEEVAVNEDVTNKEENNEFVEIKDNKHNVSLFELEQQIENEKKQNKGTQGVKSKVPAKKLEEEKEEEEVKVVTPTPKSMPIYTEEELQAMDEEDEEGEYDDEYDYEEYDEEYDDYK